jgi:hypothetical protein
MLQSYRHLVAATDESGRVWGERALVINCRNTYIRPDFNAEIADSEQWAYAALYLQSEMNFLIIHSVLNLSIIQVDRLL